MTFGRAVVVSIARGYYMTFAIYLEKKRENLERVKDVAEVMVWLCYVEQKGDGRSNGTKTLRILYLTGVIEVTIALFPKAATGLCCMVCALDLALVLLPFFSPPSCSLGFISLTKSITFFFLQLHSAIPQDRCNARAASV